MPTKYSKTAQSQFGKLIFFNCIFSHVAYIKETELKDTKLYVEDKFSIVQPKSSVSGHIYFPPALRKVIFKTKNGNGIIIGQTYKREGFYNPRTGGGLSTMDHEPAYLKHTKTYSFWIVATDLNKTVLILK